MCSAYKKSGKTHSDCENLPAPLAKSVRKRVSEFQPLIGSRIVGVLKLDSNKHSTRRTNQVPTGLYISIWLSGRRDLCSDAIVGRRPDRVLSG